jgi:hypothetical protein
MELLQAAHRCLTPGGLLVIVTPDISSLAARVMGHRWWHFRSAHIGYFSRQTMLAALESAGFQVEKIVPYTWWFPLGYVMKRLESYLPLGFVNRLMGANRLWVVILKGSVPVNLRDSYVYFAKTSEMHHTQQVPDTFHDRADNQPGSSFVTLKRGNYFTKT